MKFQVDILKYIGKISDGILVLLSITYDGNYYESTFYYNNTDILLTVSDDLEKVLCHTIYEDDDYVKLLSAIIKKIAPYDEIINNINSIE